MSKVMVNTLTVIGKWKYPGDKFLYEKEILVKQTNLMGNTYFVNYIEWQGEAREKFLLQHPAAMEFLQQNTNVLLITYCLYHHFIENTFFGDRIRIEVTTRNIEKYDFVIVFRYFNVRSNTIIGEGWQKICFSDRNTSTLCPVPQLFLDLAEPVCEYEEKSKA